MYHLTTFTTPSACQLSDHITFTCSALQLSEKFTNGLSGLNGHEAHTGTTAPKKRIPIAEITVINFVMLITKNPLIK